MSEAVYVGHDARLCFRVHGSGGDPLDLSETGERVGRALFHMAGRTLDSDAHPSAFDWRTRGAEGVLEISLTGFDFPAGAHGARLVIYGPSWPLGIVVADGYPVRVAEAVEGVEPSVADLSALRALIQSPEAGLGSDLVAWRGRPGLTVTDALAAASGVHGVGEGAVVGTTLAQTLANKTLTAPAIMNGTLDAPVLSHPVIAPAHWAGAVHAHADPDTGGTLVHRAVTRGALCGLKLAVGSDAAELAISPGVAAGENLQGLFVLGAELRKNIAAAWAEGNAGGFPPGIVRASGAWYHVFLIGRWDAAAKSWAVDAGFDSALDAANLRAAAGASYTDYRRVGSVFNANANGMRRFRQHGNRFVWETPQQDAVSVDLHTAREAKTLSAPQGVRTTALFTLTVDNDSTAATGEFHCIVSDPDAPAVTPSSSARTLAVGIWNESGTGQAFLVSHRCEAETDLLGRVAVQWSGTAAGVTYDLDTAGWVDHRGTE